MKRQRKHKIAIHGLNLFADKKMHLIRNRQDFTTQTTTYTARIIRMHEGRERVEMFYDSVLRKREMGLASKLKSQIRKNIDKVPDVPFDRIKYCVYNYPLLKPKTILDNVVEIDINSAYITACLQLGLIDRELYDRMNQETKITRLKCLGSIATRNVVTEYNSGSNGSMYIKEDATLRKAWFYIVRTIDNILLTFAEMYDNFLFYYVDGIYVLGNSNAQNIINELEGKGYGWKRQDGLQIKVGKLGDLLVTDPDGEQRIFNVRRTEFRKWVNV